MTRPRIPILDLRAEVDHLWPELNRAVQDVLRSTEFILGPQERAFEGEIATWLGAPHAVGLNSGTDALVIALRALGIGLGDEVITSPFTFFATAEAIGQVGAEPVFADIDPATFNLDPDEVRGKITQRTKAIMPVHLYGQSANMGALLDLGQERGLRIIEDVAQAIGATYRGQKVGTLGDVGCFSFFPSKNLGAFGDGGLLVTGDPALADRARMLRAHGSRKKYHNETLGYNSRLDEIQAAILRVKLPHLEAWTERRRAVARAYDKRLADIEGIETPRGSPDARHVYHQYTIRVKGGLRDAVQAKLSAEGIGTMVYYPTPIHQLPLYAQRRERHANSEAAAAEVLSLPVGPFLEEKTVEEVALALRRAVEQANAERRG